MSGIEWLLAAGLLVASVSAWRLARARRTLLDANGRLATEARAARRVAGLLSALPEPLLIVDRHGAWLEGVPIPDRTNAVDIFRSIPQVERESFLETLRRAIDSDERELFRFERDSRCFIAEIVPVEPPNHGDRAAMILIRDVTESERAAREARRLAERNDAILRSSMDGFFVVGPDYHFREVNDAFCRMTGYAPQELLHMTIADLEAKGAIVAPNVSTGLHQYPTAHRHKDGHIVYLEVSLLVLRDGGQRILVGFARDVTERRRSQEALERLSRLHELILDSAAEGICGVDRQGLATFLNPAALRLLGLEDHEPIGADVHRLLYGGTESAMTCKRERCAICAGLVHGSGHSQAEDIFRQRNGETIDVEYSSTAIYTGSELVGAVLIFRDVSERRRAEQERRVLEAQVQQAQKLESLGLLAGGIAHDFNNILVGILGNASLAQEQTPPDSPCQTRLDRIVKAGERASKIIHQILAYAGRVTCEVSPLNLNDLIEEIAGFMAAALPKSVTLELDLAPQLPTIEADHGQLQQAITNLIMNAADAIGDKPGRVTIRTSARQLSEARALRDFAGQRLAAGAYVAVEVVDTGKGMSPETMLRIFEPFYTEKPNGRGLGLAAIRGIARAHRGGVHVSSAVDHGSTFTLVFPASGRSTAGDRDATGHGEAPAGATVLVIDDEEEIRDVLRLILESRGMRVLAAADGASGVATFRKHAGEVDLTLLDMTMPDMSGIDVFHEIIAIRPDAKVMISSGYSQEDIASRIGDARVAGFVHKPYTTANLMSKIAAALAPSGASA